jgi:raffinose/stachyose/melibiose transport system substrate-binding protein
MMHTTTTTRRRRAVALVAALGLALAACGGDDDDAGGDDATADAGDDGTGDDAANGDDADSADSADTGDGDGSGDTGDGTGDDAANGDDAEPVTISWWHIQNNDPGLSDWQAMADEFSEMHPHVSIDINVLENEAFKAAIQTNLQAGDVPDLFQSWGGGGLLQQVDAGLVQDITAATDGWIGQVTPGAASVYEVDGNRYGVPFDIGMVGIWYNQDLFAEAGLEAPADTWEGLLEQVQTLKDAGITPIAVGAGDKWPAHFWYSYLMVRECGPDGMNEIVADNDFERECVIEAGRKVADLVALEPFQEGFLGAGWDAPDGESGTMASQNAAMDLMGQWAPSAFETQAGVEEGEDLPWSIGWSPFPAVAEGAGAPTDAFGGTNGFVVGKDAPPEAVEFLEFITNAENQTTWATNSGIPANPDAFSAISDESLLAVLDGLQAATFNQQYLDQFFTAEVGAQINDQTALLFAGATTPEEAAAAITATAGG